MHKPDLRRYRVHIQPATFIGAVTRVAFSHPDDQTHTIQATCLTDMQEQVRALATAFNQPCRVSVGFEGRKPPGFDAASGAVRDFGRTR